MLHDAIMRTVPPRADRRSSTREVSPRGEMVLLWHHDMETAIRYPLLDRAEDGVRLLSATPLLEGMTGTAATLLPEGTPLNRPCAVRWCRPRADGGGYEAGLRMM